MKSVPSSSINSCRGGCGKVAPMHAPRGKLWRCFRCERQAIARSHDEAEPKWNVQHRTTNTLDSLRARAAYIGGYIGGTALNDTPRPAAVGRTITDSEALGVTIATRHVLDEYRIDNNHLPTCLVVPIDPYGIGLHRMAYLQNESRKKADGGAELDRAFGITVEVKAAVIYVDGVPIMFADVDRPLPANAEPSDFTLAEKLRRALRDMEAADDRK